MLGRRGAGTAALQDRDSESIAGGAIDLSRVRPGQADDLKPRQALEQRCREDRPLPDRDDGVEIREPRDQGVLVVQPILEYDDIQAVELPEAVQRPDRVLEVVQDGTRQCLRLPFVPGCPSWMCMPSVVPDVGGLDDPLPARVVVPSPLAELSGPSRR